jgi:hypothetical protein
MNVSAWSRAFCFRQFQLQKTPLVTVLREIRCIETAQEFCLFEKIRLTADVGCFTSYFNWMGGHRLKQCHRPVKIYYERSVNHYQKLMKKTAGLEGSGLTVLTREKQWTLVKKEQTKKDLGELALGLLGTLESGGSRFPWTSVNNCPQGANPLENTCVPDIETSNQAITMSIEPVIPIQVSA